MAKVLQHWEGVIEEVFKDYFTADLTDLTAGGTDEYAEKIPFENVNKSDIWRIGKDVIFEMKVWSNNKISIEFPKRPKTNIEKIMKRAEYLNKNLKWE